jgi:exodeoxyribonuclease V beta subunit
MPRGIETGILIHRVFEILFSSSHPIWRDLEEVNHLIARHLSGTSLCLWIQGIQEMVWKTLHLPLTTDTPFTLSQLVPGELRVEMEFLFSQAPNYIKGFIDLVFRFNGKFYFLDWKTNWLGPDDASYIFLDEAMAAHDYWLQAKLYKEALRRYVKQFYIQPFEEIFGGAIYLFLRGGGVCHIRDGL